MGLPVAYADTLKLAGKQGARLTRKLGRLPETDTLPVLPR
jgi:hypothetical protein